MLRHQGRARRQNAVETGAMTRVERTAFKGKIVNGLGTGQYGHRTSSEGVVEEYRNLFRLSGSCLAGYRRSDGPNSGRPCSMSPESTRKSDPRHSTARPQVEYVHFGLGGLFRPV